MKDKVLVRLLPSPETSGLVVRAPTDTPIRRCEVVTSGPDATVGPGTYLATILAGQSVSDDLLLLPSAPGKSAFLARLDD